MPVNNNTNYPVKSPYNGINALDYVPILSIPSNVAILILKIIFSIFSIKASSENSFIAFVINKSSARCFLATVLPFGFLIMIPLDIIGRKKEVVINDDITNVVDDLKEFLVKYPKNIENKNETDGYQSKKIEHLYLELLEIQCQSDKDDKSIRAFKDDKSIRAFFQSCVSFIDHDVDIDKTIHQELLFIIGVIDLLESKEVKNGVFYGTLNNGESWFFSKQFINMTPAIAAFIQSPDDDESKNKLVKEKDLLKNKLLEEMKVWILAKTEEEHSEISIDENNSDQIEEDILGDNSENSSNDVVVDKEPNTQQITTIEDVEKKTEQNTAHDKLYDFIFKNDFQDNLLVNQIPEKFEIEFLLDTDSETNPDKLIKSALCYEYGIGLNKNLLKAIELYYKAVRILHTELEDLKHHTTTHKDESYQEKKLQMIKNRELLCSKIHYQLFLLEIIARPQHGNIEKQFDLAWKLSTEAQKQMYSRINKSMNIHMLEKNKDNNPYILPIEGVKDRIVEYKRMKSLKTLLIKGTDNNISNNSTIEVK